MDKITPLAQNVPGVVGCSSTYSRNPTNRLTVGLVLLTLRSIFLLFMAKYNNTGHGAAELLKALPAMSRRVTAKHINYESFFEHCRRDALAFAE